MFKQCTKCERTWEDRNAYLCDPDIRLVGYQINFDDLKLGIFLFNHLSCQTTLAIDAAKFIDLYDGPIYTESQKGTEACEEHCLYTDDLERCANHCECAYVREIIQILRSWSTRPHETQEVARAPGA